MRSTYYSPLQIVASIFFAVLLSACSSTPSDDTGTGVDDGSSTTIDGDMTTTVTPGGDDDGLSGGSLDGAAANLPTVFYFDYDQATLAQDIRSVLDAHAAALRASSRMVRLEGHADERGTREYNLALGERRAKAVANYLVLQGVDRARIETVSYGEERPANLGQDEEAFRLNRRVELK